MNPPIYDAIIIGSGFGGLGMAIELRKRYQQNFLILEKGNDVGGVWRENTYPGAACDVPSHLYSFSFFPNPNWEFAFARQPEIFEYLRRCADHFDLRPHLRFGAEVSEANFDDSTDTWSVYLKDGQQYRCRNLITAMGQLSMPSLPKLEGIESFKGESWHSAHWNHDFDLGGKRVAVVGTGASAIQFVPAIVDQVQSLKLFQRTPSYIVNRPDRKYRDFEKKMWARFPWLLKLHRLKIYIQYESRALAFTRLKGLLKLAISRPFYKYLDKKITDPVLKEKLIPDYPVGCKRILLSSNYLPAMVKPNLDLITTGIKRVVSEGIETADGVMHKVDAIIYGTGFAATRFLTPLKITGAKGLDLNDAWRAGAKGHLGVTVPGFPNFFMLYGPNTNLGHNSIVYMLESQIAYVSRALARQRDLFATRVEINEYVYSRYNQGIQKALLHTVWNGCKSWYVDENGYNSTGWPGFTLTYRLKTKMARLNEFAFSSNKHADVPTQIEVRSVKAADPLDNALAVFFRGFLRVAFRAPIGEPFGVWVQRAVVKILSPLMPGTTGTLNYNMDLAGVKTRVTASREGESGQAVLYLHGGAFCLGSPKTHRSITQRIANESQATVYTIDYRLAPEHPYPAQLEDAKTAYVALLERGYRPDQIVLAGDSAGGAMCVGLSLALKELNLPQPSGLALLSPVTDPSLSGVSISSKASLDPMVRLAWLKQGLKWLKAPENNPYFNPLHQNLADLPPMLIQVGDREVLLSDSIRLAEHARDCGVTCELEVHESRWHVFHLQAFFLRSARLATQRIGAFVKSRRPQEKQQQEAVFKKAA